MAEVEMTLLPGEQEKIDAAKAALVADVHAPREVSVSYSLHIHNDFPLMLYKDGKTVIVNNQEDADAAVADGWGGFVPEAPNA